MHSRLNDNNAISPSAWGYSFAVHLCVGLSILAGLYSTRPQIENVEFEVYEFPKTAPTVPTVPIREEPKPKVEEKVNANAVFGLNKKAITQEASEDSEHQDVSIKTGNTIAKEVDDKELKEDDPESLPIPAEAYLVSEMPQLASEVRVEYPEQARSASVEGPVVMDLLIDGEGKVRDVQLVEGPGYGLNEAAMKAIRNFRFRPGRVGERAVAVRIRYVYRFVLE